MKGPAVARLLSDREMTHQLMWGQVQYRNKRIVDLNFNIKIKMIDNITLPMARSPLSKSRRTPRKRKATPKPARPTPISAKT